MAFRNKTIRNPVTGQDITFLQTANDTNGQLLEMVATFRPGSHEPIAHYHPQQVENFEVLSGELTVRLNDRLTTLKQGDKLHIDVNQVHAMWNDSPEQTVVNWQVRPALETEYFLETASGLVTDGKTNEKGMPSLLQVALLVNRFSSVFRMAKPSFAVQKILFTLLTPFAYLVGYRPMYKKYLD